MIPADYHTSCFQENNCEDFMEQFPVKGCIEFDEALEIYLDVCQYDINDEKRSDQLRTTFKDALMDDESGLRCFIFTAINRKQYIVLDSDEIDLKSYFLELIEQDDEFLHENKFRTLSVDNHNQLHRYIMSLDTEYDKNVVKAILGMVLTNNDLELIGIKGSVAKKRLSLLDNICTELDNAELAAKDMLRLRLSGKIEKIKNELDDLEKNSRKVRVVRETY